MSTPAPSDERVRIHALLGVFALLMVARAPWLFVAPRFFAEEGILYFRYALDHGFLDTLVSKHLGYYALVPNVATAFAARLPLVLAPFATLLFAFAVQMIPAFVIVHDRALWPRTREKALALLVLVLPLAMRREWLSTIHSQFWLALAMCLMLVVPPRNRSAAALYAVTTLTAALTGALSDALAPCFLLLGLVRRDRRLLVSGVVLGACALFQAQSLAAARSIAWDARELLSVSVGKLVFVPFAGKFAAPLTRALFVHAHDTVPVVLLALVSVVALVAVLRRLPRDGQILLLASTYLGVASLVAALGPHADLAEPMHGIRYVFVPNVVFGLLFVHGLARVKIRSPLTLAYGAMITVGAIGAMSAAAYYDAGFAYRADARAYARDKGRTLRVHGDACRLSPDAAAARRGFVVETLPSASPDRVRVAVHTGQFDRRAELRFFVLATSSDGSAIRSFDGEHYVMSPMRVIGDASFSEPGGCMMSDPPVRFGTFARGHGARLELELPVEQLRGRPPESAILIGYGRDEADALAKGTLAEFWDY